MKRNSKKGLLFGITALAAAVLGVAVISQSAANGGLFTYRLSAVNVTGGSITFTGSTVSGTRSVSTATTSTGGIIKCVVTDNDSSISSNYVAALVKGTTIRFYENDESTEYTFEDVNSFSLVKSDATTYYSFDHYYVTTSGVSDKFTWGRSKNQTRSPNYQGNNPSLDVSNFWVVCTTSLASDGVAYLTSITINYDCATKHQSGLTIDTAPTKTTYLAGESFDPSGMIVKAEYDNSISVATIAYSVYPSVLSVSDTFVTVSYGGFSDTQSITVRENEYAGTYLYTSGSASYSIVLNADFTGLYNYVNTAYSYDYKMHFTYSISGSTITFIKDAQTGDAQNSGGYYNLFTTDADSTYEKQNSATFETSNEKLYIKLYTCASSSRAGSSKSLYKQ